MQARNKVTVVQALRDPNLFGGLPAFQDLTTWASWIVFMKACYGLPLTRHERKVFEQHTGRSTYAPPAGGYPEAVAIVGVQSGKSKIAVVFADHAALIGESGTHAVLIGQDHRGSMRVLLRYAREPFETLDPFKAEVIRNTADTVELRNGVSLSAYPCRPEAVRGLRACIVVIDELAFFTATDGRPVDTEMLRVARGRVATTGGKVIVLSSPYGQSGALWDLHRNHYGREDSSTLVWQASAPEMNPTLPTNYLEKMAQDDPEAYRSEVLGEFRAGIATLFDPDALAACVDDGVRERPRQPGTAMRWFVDAASGSGTDRYTLAGAHHDAARNLNVLDMVRSWSPPFNPSGVMAEIADILKGYDGGTELTGDRYAPGFVLEQARANGLTYHFSELDRSQLYLEVLPLVNAAQARVLDVPDLLRELRGLERRRGTSGKDRVDHRPGQHDDLANAAAGALVLAAQEARRVPFAFFSGGRSISAAPVVQHISDTVASVVDQVTETITSAAKAIGKVMTPPPPKPRPEPVRRKSYEEMALLMKGDLTEEEQQRFDKEVERRRRNRKPSELEERVMRVGPYWPNDLPNPNPGDLASALEEVRRTFSMWR